MSKELWNERFANNEYAYGEVPNTFLKQMALQIPKGPVLCLADGEGRNGVHLASLGYSVTSVDWSEAGLKKAQTLAAKRDVRLSTILADLNDYEVGHEQWNGIVLIFAHFPPALRQRIHKACVKGLAPGGVLILESYSKDQMNLQTGGPKDPDLLMSKPLVLENFAGLETLHLVDTVRNVSEGMHHSGDAAVIQYVGKKRR